MNILKKGFTIVEMTVVVAILAILATISIISLQSQNLNARNSVRATDLSNIRKSLDSYFTTTSNYPETTNPGKVTYSGSELLTIWEQGTFGETTRRITGDLSNIPLDPLTKTEYIYSVSNDKQEYQVAGIIEGSSDIAYGIVNKANASENSDFKLKIGGNYNGEILKYKKAKKLYIFAVPSLIHSKIGDVSVIDIIDNKDLLYTGNFKIPEIYKIDTNGQGEILVKSDKILVFSGAENDLFNGDVQDDFIDKLKSAYTGTDLINKGEIKEIVNSHENNKRYLSQIIIRSEVLPNLKITSENGKNPVITCGDKSPGETFDVDGVTYTVVDNDMLAAEIGNNDTAFYETACTSLVTDMNTANYYNGGVFYNSTINPDLSHWDTSNVTDMSYMFRNASSFNQPLNWDTSNVTDMKALFAGASSFNQSLDWDTSNVTDMKWMFNRASSLNQPLNLDTSNVTNMYSMFNEASSFNQPLNWNTSNVTNMEHMFKLASSFNKSLSFDTSKVTSMYSMFNLASSFNKSLSFDTSKVTRMDYMFYKASSFNQQLSFDTSKVTKMDKMFMLASSFNKSLVNFNTSSVTDMNNMFDSASNFDQDISSWCVSNISSKPSSFDDDSGFEGESSKQPQWGTCP